MPKRQREPFKNGRPPPPPPPPRSLVRLLQSNKSVLEYFTLLQANLEADKEKWRDRANAFKKECLFLREKVRKQKHILSGLKLKQDANELYTSQKKSSRTSPSEAITAKETSNERSLGKEIIKSKMMLDFSKHIPNISQIKENKYGNEKADVAPILDNVIEKWWNDLSSEDSSSSTEKNYGVSAKLSSPSRLESINLSESEKSSVCNALQILFPKKLKEAHKNLESLGVSLVEDGKRRRDSDVVADLLHALRVLTRVQLLKDWKRSGLTAPFIGMEPACNYKEHPAFKAKRRASAALHIMEKYCFEMEDEEWENLTEAILEDEDSSTSLISTGMRNRQSLVRRLMQSLNSEISNCWPVLDRASRIISIAIHYDSPDEGSEYRHLDEDNFGVKSQVQLSTIVERTLLVQLVTTYLDELGDSLERLALFFRYVIATAPSLKIEQYPKYPPVLSLCVVEALLTKDGKETNAFLQKISEYDDLLKCAFVAIHSTAMIWRKRLRSNDKRISDVGRVELASYERLLKLNLNWIGNPLLNFEEIELRCGSVDMKKNPLASLIANIVISNNTAPNEIGNFMEESNELFLKQVFVYSVVSQQLEIRRLSHYRDTIGFPDCKDAFSEQEGFLDNLMAKIRCIDSKSKLFLTYTSFLLKCCLFLSHGSFAASVAELVINTASGKFSNKISSPEFQSFVEAAKTPLIRVVNLKRRTDRRNAFQSQVKVERLLIVFAVTCFEAKKNENLYYWGNFAFDGNATCIREINDTTRVARDWRPSDLKAFDKDAWDNGSPVKMSRSERACALSHIASWEGVRRSLELSFDGLIPSFPHSLHVQRMFKISGFAKGEPLHKSNINMPPAPVCIIMEDDAILIDRFSDRLEGLLEELPRDFHFCSIGYSRPRFAPIVTWSAQVGIPSCIWYLTGYLLSLDGAKYLLGNLPVQGPVDSWVGLKMCANWENRYGQSIGVGMQTKRVTVSPTKEELQLILKFRAFCSLTPLCSQRVAINPAAAGQSWRKRDTDIEYSGSFN